MLFISKTVYNSNIRYDISEEFHTKKKDMSIHTKVLKDGVCINANLEEVFDKTSDDTLKDIFTGYRLYQFMEHKNVFFEKVRKCDSKDFCFITENVEGILSFLDQMGSRISDVATPEDSYIKNNTVYSLSTPEYILTLYLQVTQRVINGDVELYIKMVTPKVTYE